jgi:hypothetical protein
MEEMTLAEHRHLIEQLAPQGTYEPFRVPILPWRPRCRTHLFDTKISHSCVEGRTVDSVTVADQPSHVGVGTDSLDDLLCSPPGRGVCRNVDVEDAAAFQREHEEHLQHLERRGRHCEESIAMVPARWVRRNVTHVVDGGRPGVRETHLRRSVSEFVQHYRFERNHQGLGNNLIDGAPCPANTKGGVERRERLGGLLNFYHRGAE